MRVFINGKLYDSLKTPILLVLDEGEQPVFGDMARYVSAPANCTIEEREKLIHTDIDNMEPQS